METIIDKIRRTRTPDLTKILPTTGMMWVTILVEYDYQTGEAKVLRSFSKPAKESYIKKITKVKPKVYVPKIEVEDTKGTKLF